MITKDAIEQLVYKRCYKFLDKPVILTSGEALTPFFLNGENLIGDNAKNYSKFEMDPIGMMRFVRGELETSQDFRNSIEYVIENSNLRAIEYISGGRTRDWPFSAALAIMANKKALFLYKPQDNQTPVVLDPKLENSIGYPQNLNGAKVFHIVDLVTSASSVTTEGGWLDQIRLLNGNINRVYAAIDRNQGATTKLKEREVKLESAVQINKDWLKTYDPKHTEVVQAYLKDTQKWSINYLSEKGLFCLLPYLISTNKEAQKDNRILKFIKENNEQLTKTGLLEDILDISSNYKANTEIKKGLNGGESLIEALHKYGVKIPMRT